MKNIAVVIASIGIIILHPPAIAQAQADSPLVNAHPIKATYSCRASTMVYDFRSKVVTSASSQPIIMIANIEQKPLFSDQKGTLFKYSLSNIQLAGLSPTQKTELIKTIGNNLYVFYKPDGTILELYGYSNTPLWDYNALKSIMLTLQVILPETDTSETTYQAEEKDDKGVVIAGYKITSNRLIKKQRKSYKTMWDSSANINIDGSEITIHLNNDGTIQNIDMRERISIGSQQHPLFSSDYHQQLSLKEIRQSSTTNPTSNLCPYSALVEAYDKEQLIRLPFAHFTNTQDIHQQKIQKLKNVNLESLVVKLLPPDGAIQKPAEVIASLIELFTYYPENLQKVPDLLNQNASNSLFTGHLIASIAQVKTTESQKILLEVMKRFNDNRTILTQTIVAHHSTPLSSPANAEYLISLYQASNDPELKTWSY